jgi:hypothetical protein
MSEQTGVLLSMAACLARQWGSRAVTLAATAKVEVTMKNIDTSNDTSLSRLAAILQLMLIVAGCSAIQQTYGISATDLTWIKVGMPRTEIEAKLGPGVIANAPKESGATVKYEFDRGYHPPAHDSPFWWPAAAVGWETMNLGSLGTRSYWERECQKSLLELHYDAAGVLVGAREEMVVDVESLRRGTQDICDRIRGHLLPSTLDVDEKCKSND